MGTDNLLSSSMVKKLLLQGIQWERVNGLLDVNSKVLLVRIISIMIQKRARQSPRCFRLEPNLVLPACLGLLLSRRKHGRSPECVYTPSSSFLLQPWLDNDITWWRLFFQKNPGQIYKNDAQAA
ncbi:hypothetical protein H8959_019347 [Pygathrix nigripes]